MVKYKDYIGKWWYLDKWPSTEFFVIKIESISSTYYKVFTMNKDGHIEKKKMGKHWMSEKIEPLNFSYLSSRNAIKGLFK